MYRKKKNTQRNGQSREVCWDTENSPFGRESGIDVWQKAANIKRFLKIRPLKVYTY